MTDPERKSMVTQPKLSVAQIRRFSRLLQVKEFFSGAPVCLFSSSIKDSTEKLEEQVSEKLYS